MTASQEPRPRFGSGIPRTTATSTASPDGVFGRVMALVAVTLGTFALGVYLGRGLSGPVGIGLLIAAIVCLVCLSEVSHQLRPTPASKFLLTLGVLLGLGLSAVLSVYVNADMTVVWEAAGASAGVVAALAAGSYAMRRDLSRLARAAFGVLLLLVLLGVATIVGTAPSAHTIYILLGPLVFGGHAALNFRLLRRIGMTEAVPLAAGIFVDIIDVMWVLRLLRR